VYTRIYDKRRDYDFIILGMISPFSNLPSYMGYNVISSQFYRYARVCSFKKDFMENCNITINILKRNGFKDIILRKFIKKFFNKNNWV